jgi:hypothetical protein
MKPQEHNLRLCKELNAMGIPVQYKISFSGTPYIKGSNFTVCYFGKSKCFRIFVNNNKQDVKGSPYSCASQIKTILGIQK